MEQGLAMLQVAAPAGSRHDPIIVQDDALQRSEIDDYVDRIHRSPTRFKSHPMSDDGFDDSAIGPEVEYSPPSGNLDACMREDQYPDGDRHAVMRENQYPYGDRQTLPSFREAFGGPSFHTLGEMPSTLTSGKSRSETFTPVIPGLQKLPLTAGRKPSPRNDRNPASREQPYDQKRALPSHTGSKIDKQGLGQHEACSHSSIDVSESSDALLREDISSEDIWSAEDASPPSENGLSRLEILHAKHQIVVNIMRDVYVLFDPQGTAGAKTLCWTRRNIECTGPVSQ